MKITKENINVLPKNERDVISSYLDDLNVLNNKTNAQLYIDWQDYHDEYSPERTDPCPDYYGCYQLMTENVNLYKQRLTYSDCTLSGKLPLDVFEDVLFSIGTFIDFYC